MKIKSTVINLEALKTESPGPAAMALPSIVQRKGNDLLPLVGPILSVGGSLRLSQPDAIKHWIYLKSSLCSHFLLSRQSPIIIWLPLYSCPQKWVCYEGLRVFNSLLLFCFLIVNEQSGILTSMLFSLPHRPTNYGGKGWVYMCFCFYETSHCKRTIWYWVLGA